MRKGLSSNKTGKYTHRYSAQDRFLFISKLLSWRATRIWSNLNTIDNKFLPLGNCRSAASSSTISLGFMKDILEDFVAFLPNFNKRRKPHTTPLVAAEGLLTVSCQDNLVIWQLLEITFPLDLLLDFGCEVEYNTWISKNVLAIFHYFNQMISSFSLVQDICEVGNSLMN